MAHWAKESNAKHTQTSIAVVQTQSGEQFPNWAVTAATIIDVVCVAGKVTPESHCVCVYHA